MPSLWQRPRTKMKFETEPKEAQADSRWLASYSGRLYIRSHWRLPWAPMGQADRFTTTSYRAGPMLCLRNIQRWKSVLTHAVLRQGKLRVLQAAKVLTDSIWTSIYLFLFGLNAESASSHRGTVARMTRLPGPHCWSPRAPGSACNSPLEEWAWRAFPQQFIVGLGFR